MWPSVKTSKLLLGVLLTLASHNSMQAQTDEHNLPSDSTGDTEPAAAPSRDSAVTPSENKTKATLFYFLAMSGKTHDQLQPLTQSQRAEAYTKVMCSPFTFLNTETS